MLPAEELELQWGKVSGFQKAISGVQSLTLRVARLLTLRLFHKKEKKFNLVSISS